MVELRRRYPRDAAMIPDMRTFVTEGCRRIWEEVEDAVPITQLELAVSEAAGNVILHGFQGRDDDRIELILKVEKERACVTFLYPGCAFTPQTVPTPDFSGHAESGFGWYLIQQSVNEVQFSRDEAGICRIRLVRNRHKE